MTFLDLVEEWAKVEGITFVKHFKPDCLDLGFPAWSGQILHLHGKFLMWHRDHPCNDLWHQIDPADPEVFNKIKFFREKKSCHL